jgi:pimeloyl-ACP methyl ester carboxylesterase
MAVIGLSTGAVPGQLRLTPGSEVHLPRLTQARGPLIIMLHGYKYHPGIARHCPHRSLFSPENPLGWPTHLELDRLDATAIGFGWCARGNLRQIFIRAGTLGADLAATIRRLRQIAPHRKIHIIAHSMGAEVTLSALSELPAGSLQRIILLSGAAFQARAETALQTPAGATAEVINITSRENDIFDFALECLVPAPRRGDRVIGAGLKSPNAVTLQIDCPATLDALSGMEHMIAPSRHLICHWSSYTRPGSLRFYAQCFSENGAPPLAQLKRVSADQSAPRWARLSLGTALKTRMMGASTAGDIHHGQHAN